MNNEECAHELEMCRPYQSNPRVDEAMERAVQLLRTPTATGAAAMREACFEVADEVATMCAEDPSVVNFDADPMILGAALTEIVDRCVANHSALPAPEVPE